MDKVDWLLSHNKNYTQEQYYTLDELKDQLTALHEALDFAQENLSNEVVKCFIKQINNILKG